jgi:hypothetical protein
MGRQRDNKWKISFTGGKIAGKGDFFKERDLGENCGE